MPPQLATSTHICSDSQQTRAVRGAHDVSEREKFDRASVIGNLPGACACATVRAGPADHRHARGANATSDMLRRLATAACLILLASAPAAAGEPVSLQLKWKHQFQFAGYYAALEQGFYRDAGLDVTIREGGPGIDVAEAVASGKADFGACSANVLREWAAGRRLVVLAAIFQRP